MATKAETMPILKEESSGEDDVKISKGCCSISRVRFFLYGSHAISSWGVRMWSFAVGMFMIDLSPDTLRLTAIYGLAGGLAITLTGPIMGNWVDRYPRMKVAGAMLVVTNVSIALSALAVYLTVSYLPQVAALWGGWGQTLCHAVIIFFAIVADAASNGRTLAIERDWIVVISEDTKTLTEMSAFLRRIDLSCKLFAPVVAGQVITYGSVLIGALFLSSWNIFMLLFEFYMLHNVYHSVPDLASKNEVEKRSEQSCGMLLLDSVLVLPRGWRTYSAQPCVLAGLGLALLYMTVIGFDNVTTGFAKAQGLSESVISIFMSAAGVTGIIGTFLFPALRSCVGLTRAGLFAFTIDTITLTPCILSVFAPGSPFDPLFFRSLFDDPAVDSSANTTTPVIPDPVTSVAPEAASAPNLMSVLLLMSGIVLSRIGLWSADLAVTQYLLETPRDEERGVVNGVQISLNRMMDMFKFILVIVVPWPEAFGYLIMLSFLSCAVGAVLYYVFSFRQRGHLMPFHKYKEKLIPGEDSLRIESKKSYGTNK